MSLNDPLIRELKVHLVRLHQDGKKNAITDYHPSLQPFCQTFECILRKGLKGLATAVGLTKQDYWIWIQALSKSGEASRVSGITQKAFFLFKTSVEMTEKCNKIRSVQGRGRYFIRLSLMKNILAVPIQLLHLNTDFQKKNYDGHVSILTDELLTEVLLSALYETAELNFALNAKNSSYLDETWLMPVYKSYEFVPCDSLGIKVGYVCGRAIAVTIATGSLAAEDDKIEVGDILDELYGESLYLCKKWKIPHLLKHHRGMPVQLDVIKGHFSSGELFPPAAAVLRQLNINLQNLVQLYRQKEMAKRKKDVDSKNYKPDFPGEIKLKDSEFIDNKVSFLVQFIGKVYLGKDGTKERIIYGISEVLRETTNKQEVVFETKEAHLIIKDPNTREVLYEHSYTMIGACGRPKHPQTYFAYTLGETSCNLSQNFNCYVYQTPDAESSKVILQNIAKGFERTHWAV